LLGVESKIFYTGGVLSGSWDDNDATVSETMIRREETQRLSIEVAARIAEFEFADPDQMEDESDLGECVLCHCQLDAKHYDALLCRECVSLLNEGGKR
jgi:hypothetical protein